MKEKAIFIVGPTASGKSALAIWLAKKIKAEIINADSRQVYKYLDVGSGKIDIDDKLQKIKNLKSGKVIIGGVVHHLVSIVSPRKNYSLGQWLKDVDRVVEVLKSENKKIIFCGGTILYLRALYEGWQLPEVKADPNLRKKLEKEDSLKLWKRLYKLDKRRALAIDYRNKRRVIRALEIALKLGKVPAINFQPKFELLILSPLVDEKLLKRKIEKRLKRRIVGIIREIKRLRKIGISWKRIISFGLEYDWFGKYVRGDIELNTAFNKCLKEIIHFAKKQIRELRKFPVIYVKNRKDTLIKVKNFFNL